MAYTTTYDDLVISEGKLANSSFLGEVKCDLSFVFGAQLKSLRDVKAALSSQAKALGANAIENFTYGQKSKLLAFDDVAFWGKGVAVRIPQEDYNAFFAKQ
ncbi:MAG: hypothetical protein Q4C01_04205 [Clostridia bacterium]|nr:hypothetical protein [Clostridia bacterium]